MTFEQLRAAQHLALNHMNLCRKVRDVVLCDIEAANEHKELVSEHTLSKAPGRYAQTTRASA